MTEVVRRRRKAKLTLHGVEHVFVAPGFKSVSRPGGNVPHFYWVADEKAANAGYTPRTARIHLPEDISDAEIISAIVARCQGHQDAMLAWLAGDTDDFKRLAPKFEGTISSLADCYESDVDSAYQELKANSAEGYKPWLKMVRKTVGARVVIHIVAKDFRRWYREWKRISTTRGTDGTRQAYGGIQIVRILLGYGAESGITKCRQLRDDMKGMRFAKNPPRTATMSHLQVRAFMTTAWDRGDLFMALDQAIQFEGMFRQNDVIGQWRKAKPGEAPAPGEIESGDKIWSGITMDMMALSEELVVRTSKTGQPVVHSISSCELVVECLRKIDAKDGPIARQANGRPWPDRQAFSKAWRVIAEAAGIPKGVWNMDSRASGVSEASEAGVSDDDITKQAGNSDAVMKRVYKRRGRQASERSHEKRQIHRRKRETSNNETESER